MIIMTYIFTQYNHQIEGVKVLLSKDSKVKGNPLKIGKFFAMFKRPDSIFPIVTRPNG